MYFGLSGLLWGYSRLFFLLYCVFFVCIAVSQSYICAYGQWPFLGGFAPLTGGFWLPSNQLARIAKHAKKSIARCKPVLGLASAILLGIILPPAYFLYDWYITYLLIYPGIVLAYTISDVWLTFSRGAPHNVHPKGQTSLRFSALIPGSE